METTFNFFNTLLVYSLFTFDSVKCEIDLIVQRRSSYYKLYKAINNKICEESTLNGKLNYENSLLDKFDECSKLEAKMKLQNDTYANEICEQIHYPNSTRNDILWQIKCQWNLDKNEPYYRCLNENMLKPNISQISSINEMDSDIEENFDMLDCFKSALNVNLNASNDKEILGEYGFIKFELSKLFDYNKQLLCNKFLRNQSYKSENETEKVDKYFNCFNNLSDNCLEKINSYDENISLHYYYNTTNDDLFCNYYEYRLYLSLDAVTNKCLINDIKIKDYYNSQSVDKLKNVLECQKESLRLSDDEKYAQKRKYDYLKFLYNNYY